MERSWQFAGEEAATTDPVGGDVDQKLVRVIERARSGDEKAFSKLIDKKSRSITYITWSILGNLTEAEDAAQEAVVAMFRHLSKLKSAEAFDSWMYQIVYRSCLSVRKKEQDRIALSDIPERYLQEESIEVLPHKNSEAQEDRQILLGKINALPEKYRICLYLFYFEELSYKQIANVLDASVQDISNWLNRGKKKLKIDLIEDPEFTERDLVDERSMRLGAGTALIAEAFALGEEQTLASSGGKVVQESIRQKTVDLTGRPRGGFRASNMKAILVVGVVMLVLAGGGLALSSYLKADQSSPQSDLGQRTASSDSQSRASATKQESQPTSDTPNNSDSPAPLTSGSGRGSETALGESMASKVEIENTAHFEIVDPEDPFDPIEVRNNGRSTSTARTNVDLSSGSDTSSSQARTGDTVSPLVLSLLALVLSGVTAAWMLKRGSTA